MGTKPASCTPTSVCAPLTQAKGVGFLHSGGNEDVGTIGASRGARRHRGGGLQPSQAQVRQGPKVCSRHYTLVVARAQRMQLEQL